MLNKIAKPLLLATGTLWIALNLYNTQYAFLQSWFLALTFIGHILWDVTVLYLLSCLVLDKEKRKEKYVRVCTWVFGTAWGIRSYSIFFEHKYVSELTANIINWTALIIAVVAVVVTIYLLIGFMIWRRNKLQDKCI